MAGRVATSSHPFRRGWACTLFLAAVVTPASAHTSFDSWTTENGLPQNSITDIVQTRDGYLWLATFGGLVRFDGFRFVVFDRSVDGIGSQRIRCLYEDRTSTLWAATEDGLLIRYRHGRFTTFGPEHGLPRANAVQIVEADDGQLWITWLPSIISRFDGERAVSYAPSDFDHDVRPSPPDRYTDLWWSSDDAGLHVLIAGDVETIALGPEVVDAAVTGVSRDRAGNLWIRTNGGGVLKHGHGETRRYGATEGLPPDQPFVGFHEGSNGTVWCSLGERTYRIANGTRELVKESGLRTLIKDREGSTWLATNAGLHRVRDVSFTTYSQRNGLSWDWVYSILEDRTGAVWIGTWGGGVNRYDHGRFTAFREADGLAADRITGLYEDATGLIWIATTHGLSYVEGGRLHRQHDSSGFLNLPVWAIHRDAAGALWFGTESGLVRLAGGRLTRYTISDGLPHDRITTLFEDRRGTLWIGASRGLARFSNGQFRSYGEREGLVNTSVRAIHQDPDGVLWIGTYDSGLYRFANERLVRLTRSHGLHDNGIFQILEDADGFLWTGSNRGIARVSRRELNEVAAGRRESVTSIVFGAKDGLLSVEVNGGRQPAGLKAADGRLWFPTMGGAAVVDPAAVRINTNPPNAIVEEVRVGGQVADFSRPVTIPASGATLEVKYTAPSFIKPELLRFRYRLEGLDDRWVDAGDARAAMFHRIPPGSYRFAMMAANHHGVWNTTGPTVDIIVLPPFWRTWWFIIAAAVSFASLALAGHRHRIRRLHRQHAQQTVFSQQLIDSQENERRRISTELHDSLGQHLAILRQRAHIGLESGTEKEARKGLEEILTVAGQIDAEVKEIAYGLRPYQLDRLGLSKTLRAMVQRVGETCGIESVAEISPISTLR